MLRFGRQIQWQATKLISREKDNENAYKSHFIRTKEEEDRWQGRRPSSDVRCWVPGGAGSLSRKLSWMKREK